MRGCRLWSWMGYGVFLSTVGIFCSAVSIRAYANLKLEPIGFSQLPSHTRFAGSSVGGLSGLDYDPDSQQWILISDDKASKGPARAYLARLPISAQQVGPLSLKKMIEFSQPNGTPYPNWVHFTLNQRGDVPDFESVRFNPVTHAIRYTSEGVRILGLDPFIREAKPNGRYLSSLPIPDAVKMDRIQGHHGVYNNLAFEGSSFTGDGKYYFVAMETALQQDGKPSTATQGAPARIIQYDHKDHIIAQYVYPVEPLAKAPADGYQGENGVSEILALDARHLLVLERAGIQDSHGTYHNYIRIYQVELDGASNVKNVGSLRDVHYQPLHKKLLWDMNQAGNFPLDNYEGMSFGPRLADGRRTLVLISDDNFNPQQHTYLVGFAMDE
ncbi:esterase-like activity of phytase family protein [Celerinatantimonas sp. YJH-8]|uniref:esterase-like activity of phytase family protein n=1 Tax=Celerinatantimonas sp. YJH-8 TaxID=3228714 RepID=UPI0038BE452A